MRPLPPQPKVNELVCWVVAAAMLTGSVALFASMAQHFGAARSWPIIVPCALLVLMFVGLGFYARKVRKRGEQRIADYDAMMARIAALADEA